MRVARVLTVFAGLMGALPNAASSQVLMSTGAYSQDFDSLTNNSAAAWSDNTTLTGWYASRSAAPNSIATYNAGSGSSGTGALYSFGSAGSSERALGSVCSGTPGSIAYGVRLKNDTDFAQTNITVSFTGEQWRDASGAGAVTNMLSFSYRIDLAPITNSDAGNVQWWVAFNTLNFRSPVVNVGGSGSALDGNNAGNRQVFTNIPLTGVVVYPGQELFLRWRDVDDSGSDAGMAIDDLTITFDSVSPVAPPLSLLTYNVKGNGVADWSTNTAQAQAIGRVLTHLNADIITFNEIPATNVWQMTNWVTAFLPGYYLATNSGSDGFIRSVIASRYPITRSQRWLDGADLKPFGYTNDSTFNADRFTRDLFEAQIIVPNYPQPLHVFTTHLKSSSDGYTEAAAKRAAEAAAITNFFVTNLFTSHPTRPYVLTGDMNEANTNTAALQRLTGAASGLWLTNPTNPVTGSINTFSTTTANPSQRLDYIFPGTLLFSNLAGGQVFRSDRLTPLPSNLNSNDVQVASDHLPVLLSFHNPYEKPFQLTSITRVAETVVLTWESVLGQSYRIEASSNLVSWFAFANSPAATNNPFLFSTNTSGDVNYFRVRRTFGPP